MALGGEREGKVEMDGINFFLFYLSVIFAIDVCLQLLGLPLFGDRYESEDREVVLSLQKAFLMARGASR